jgi:hypothetical protein
VAARQSLREWPPRQSGSLKTPFGFVDGLGKVVIDVGRTHQLGLTALAGVSTVDGEEDDRPAGVEPDAGANRVSIATLSWRATIAPAFVVRQQVSVASRRSSGLDGRVDAIGTNREVVYRADLSRALLGGVLEAGWQVGHAAALGATAEAHAGRRSAWQRSGFAHFAWAVTPSLTISPGLRVTSSTTAREPARSQWLLGEWSPHPDWSVTASAGVAEQPPDLAHVLGAAGPSTLHPERAAYLELGLERRVTTSTRWQATVFRRRESSLIRSQEIHPRLDGITIVVPPVERPVNGLSGAARGLELLVERRSPLGLSGWASYTYGRARQTDPVRSQTYWGDFDQPHTLNVFAAFRHAKGMGMSATFRAGSNIPLPAHLAERDDGLVVSDRRNLVRLPPYARLDARGDHSMHYLGRRLTVFLEVLNVLDRVNLGVGEGSVNPVTGDAHGFTDPMLRRRLSAGVIVDF